MTVFALSAPVRLSPLLGALSASASSVTAYADTLTLSITPTTGTTGVTSAEVRVTPNGPIPPGGGTASLGLSGGGTLGSATLNFTAGSSAAQSTTLSRSADGTSTVTLTNSMGLSNVGTPATFTSSTAPSGQAVGTNRVNVVSVIPETSWAGSKPWACGLLFRRGAVPAGATPGAHDGSVQVSARNYWDDGSLRLAVAAGITTDDELPILARGTAASGSNVAEPSVAAVVAFTSVVDASAAAVAGGSFSANIATARTAGAGAWGHTQARLVRSILGPVMSEFHYFVPTSDVHTSVWFYVRAYSDGSTEVETVVENGWLDVASPGQRTYNVTVTIGGTERYAGTGIVHYHHTRWSRVDWAGTDPGTLMTQSPASLRDSGLVPSFGVTSVDAAAYSTKPENGTVYSSQTLALAERPAPFAVANMDPNLGAGGDTDMYGLVPEWMALYLIEGNAAAAFACIANARALGRYGLHYRDEADGRPVRGSVETAITINGTAAGMSPNYTGGTTTPAPSGSAPPSWTYSHSPAAAFAGAILTGRWSFIEEAQFQAATTDLCFNSNTRAGFRIPGYYDQNRAIGWMVRDRVHAEALTPSHFGATELTSGADYNQRLEAVGRIEAVVDEWYDLYVSGSGTGAQYSARSSALGVPWQQADFEIQGDRLTDGVHGYGGLQNNVYVACALYAFNAMPAVGSTARTRLQSIAEHFAKYPVGLLGAASGATRDWRVCTHVTIPLAEPGGNTGDSDAAAWTGANYDTWDEAYTQLQAFGTWASGTWPLTGGSDTYIRKVSLNGSNELRHEIKTTFTADTDIITFCWAVAQMHEAAGRATVTGADLAVQRLLTSDTWAHGVANLFRTRPALSLKTGRDLPSWVPSTIGEAALVTMTNSLDDVWTETAAMGGSQGANEVLDFSGGRLNPYIGRWGGHIIHGGGHSATHNNGVYVADYNDLTFKVLEAPTEISTGTPPNQYDTNIQSGVSPESFADGVENPREIATGVPGSAHTYDTMVVLPPPLAGDPQGALLRGFGGAIGYSASRETGWSHAYAVDAGSWSRWSTNYKTGNFSAGGSFVMDHTRGRGWPVHPGNAGNAYLNLVNRTWTNEGTSLSANSYPDLVQAEYVEHRDLIVAARQGDFNTSSSAGAISLMYQDAADSVPSRATATLSAALATDGNYAQASLIYVPNLQRLFWYCYDAAPDQYQEIEIPEDPTDTWTVTAKSITGAGRPSLLAQAPSPWLYKRMDFSAALRSLMWVLGKPQDQFSFGDRVIVIRIAP